MDWNKKVSEAETAVKAVAWKKIWVYVKCYVLNVLHALQHVGSALLGRGPDDVLFGENLIQAPFCERAKAELGE